MRETILTLTKQLTFKFSPGYLAVLIDEIFRTLDFILKHKSKTLDYIL